jgi:hypothetical protein
MVSATDKQFAQAMAAKKPTVCEYDGYARELCAVILGHTGGQEKALTFQFGGQSKSGLSPNGEWRWLFLEKVRNMHLRDGPWRRRAPNRKAASKMSISTSIRRVHTIQGAGCKCLPC